MSFVKIYASLSHTRCLRLSLGLKGQLTFNMHSLCSYKIKNVFYKIRVLRECLHVCILLMKIDTLCQVRMLISFGGVFQYLLTLHTLNFYLKNSESFSEFYCVSILFPL